MMHQSEFHAASVALSQAADKISRSLIFIKQVFRHLNLLVSIAYVILAEQNSAYPVRA